MKIAILLSTFNGALYLEQQLDSVLSQTYNDWVLYIRDDGSKDKTIEIINSYVVKYPLKIKSLLFNLTLNIQSNLPST